MPIKFVLRLILAFVFATVAVIFSELIPPLSGVNPTVARVLVTIFAGSLGFIVFPDIATKITIQTIAFFNFLVHQLASEILNQLLKVPRGMLHLPIGQPPLQAGGISINRPLILDTSSIIDGRVLEVVKTGFLSGLILLPNFILLELQQVADSADNLKRARGRRGFEIISDLKKQAGVKLEVWEKDAGGKAVDEKLIKLAKSLHGKILTTDFNLNKLAGAQGVVVLNVNDLSNAIKTSVVPGERIKIKLVHIGKDQKQGVGYLEDGTMIVVEDGVEYLGQNIEIEVSRVLQGSAGRMIFGKLFHILNFLLISKSIW